MRPAEQGLLQAAVLVAQRDLQVEDALAVALEAEVAGLDDACVDGPHGHLVDLLPLHPVEVGHAWNRPAWALPGVRRAIPGQVEPHGFQPGMALGEDAGLLGDLPLEQVRLGTVGREGLVAGSVQLRAQDAQRLPAIVREHRVEVQIEVGAEAGEAVPVLYAPQDGLAEGADGQLRHLPQGQALTVAEDRQIGAHGRTSSWADRTPSTAVLAWSSIAWSGRGSQIPRTRARASAAMRGAVVAGASL